MRAKGQSILEYSFLIAVVVTALMAMTVYVQRSVQSNLKMIENQVNAEPVIEMPVVIDPGSIF